VDKYSQHFSVVRPF